MHYFEEYLESIESLAPEMQRLFNQIKEKDIRMKSISDKLDRKIQNNFTRTRGYPDNKEALHQQICNEYQKAIRLADEKVNIAGQAMELIDRHSQKLQTELKKFQIELETQTPGITQQCEKRSLLLDDKNYVPTGSLRRGGDAYGDHGPQKRFRGETPDNAQRITKKQSRSTSKAAIPEISITEDLGLGQVGELLGADTEPRYCICNEVSYGEMVGCDNKECLREWFHYSCVGISEPPVGKWYCPDCTKTMKRRGQKA